MPEGSNSGFPFWKMVGGVWLVLKLKEKYDEYREVAQDDDEERVRLHRSAGHQRDESLSGDGAIALPDDTSSIAPVQATRQKKKRACCMCCGIDCSLFWKAVAIVICLSFLWQSFRFVRWMVKPSPTGLEGLPDFGSGLGCVDAPYFYNGSEFTMTRALSEQNDHAFIVSGHGVGAITIFGGDEDLTEVKYDMTIRTNIKKFDDDIEFPKPGNWDGSNIPGRLVMKTTGFTLLKPDLCQRFDVKITLPPTTRNFTVYSHTPTHIEVDKTARLNAEDIKLIVSHTWNDPGKLAMIKVHENMASKNVHLKVEGQGFIVGDLTIYDSARITTDRGNATANVKFHLAPFDPSESEDLSPSPVVLRTLTGRGRADFTVVEGSGEKRPFDIVHKSTSSASDMYLTYKASGFNGQISLDSGSHTAYNMQRIPGVPDEFPKKRPDTSVPRWNYFVGSEDGEDRMVVDTANWAGLYF